MNSRLMGNLIRNPEPYAIHIFRQPVWVLPHDPIGHEIIGANGFGYDPIFFLPEYGCTSAQLAPEKKNELSHRGEGLRKMRVILEDKMQR